MRTVAMICLLCLIALPAWAMIFEGDNDFSRTYGFMNLAGAGAQFEAGAQFTFTVTNPETLARKVGIKGLKNGEHILLRHIKGDQFEASHEATNQKVRLRLAIQK